MTDAALMIAYCLEIANYYFAYYLFFDKKLKRYFIPLISCVAIEFLYMMTKEGNNGSYWMGVYLVPLLVLAVIQIYDRMWSPLKILIVFFVETCLSEITAGIVEAIALGIAFPITQLQKGLWVYTLDLLLWGILLLFKKILTETQKEKIRQQLQKYSLFLIIIMAIIIMFTIGGLNFAKDYVDNVRFQVIVAGLSSFSYGCVGLLAFFSYYIYKTNKKIESMMNNLIQLKDMQKKYYTTLLERENDTRKYRHDMGNHLICLESLAQEENFEAMKNYLGQMREQMQEIQKRSYSVGNDILDILTNHYVARLNDSTKVNVTGHIHTEMDAMKLCTIYANLLQNAVEELEQCESEQFLEIAFKQGTEYFQIEIWNSISERHLKEWSAQSLKTSKADQRNHGIGISNVKNTVEELGGMVTVGKEGDFFHAIVSLRT